MGKTRRAAGVGVGDRWIKPGDRELGDIEFEIGKILKSDWFYLCYHAAKTAPFATSYLAKIMFAKLNPSN